MITPLYFSISPNVQTGSVYGTEFVFNSLLDAEYTNYIWDFGDGFKQYQKQAKHTYLYPGTYTVSMTAWTDYNKKFTENGTVSVDYLYRDLLVFSKKPEQFNYPGIVPVQPFVLSLTSSRINEPLAATIQIHGTYSIPHYAAPDKWSFLIPTWKILDENLNVLENNILFFKTKPLYNENNKIVGTVGTASFYYVDDLSNEFITAETCPIVITANLSTQHFSFPLESNVYPYEGYSNNQSVKAVLPWIVFTTIPTELKITENYINDFYPVKWINIPIPLTITTVCNLEKLDIPFNFDSKSVIKCLNWPPSNDIGKLHTVKLYLSADDESLELIPEVHYSVNNNLYFQKTNEEDHLVGGYIFTTITPLTALLTANLDTTFVVAASTTVQNSLIIDNTTFSFPRAFPIKNHVYVSHPNEGVFNKIKMETYPDYCREVSYYAEKGYLTEEAQLNLFQAPVLITDDITYETVAGTNDIYGIAFNPIQDVVFALDALQNNILKYDSTNSLIKQVSLENLLSQQNITPSYVTIDRKFNLWVSLYDSYSLLKFDSNLNLLLSTALYDKQDQITALSPPIVETDRLSNVWACWAHPASSCLVKFDKYGSELFRVNGFPGNGDPSGLAITPQNGVWVSCFNTGEILCYDESGVLIDRVTDLLRPSFIALDRSAQLWITHGYNLCSVYNTYTKQLSTWRFNTLEEKKVTTNQRMVVSSIIENPEEQIVSLVAKMSSELVTQLTEKDRELSMTFDEIWGGLSIDVYNRVWLIDAEKNILGRFSVNTPTIIDATFVQPRVHDKPVLLSNANVTVRVPATRTRSAQAAGDWTGNKWYQKYIDFDQTFPITGVSSPFKLYNLHKDFEVAKKNTDFNYASYCKSFSFPSVLQNSPDFFDVLLQSMIGVEGDGIKESIGSCTYEKIANFVANNSDVDTAEINQLCSLAKMVNCPIKEIGNNFPQKIKNMLSLFSIPKQKLKGYIKPKITTNLETEQLTNSSLITANLYYMLIDPNQNKRFLVYLGEKNGLSSYPIEEVEINGFKHPIYDNYSLFKILNLDEGVLADNIIDWDSPATTISYEISSDEQWYGNAGLVETIFNKILTKQLFS